MKLYMWTSLLVVAMPAAAFSAPPEERTGAKPIQPARSRVHEPGLLKREVMPVEKFLMQRVDHVRWDAVSLEEVLDWLRREGEGEPSINIIPRWNRLYAERIDRDQLITLEMRDTTIGILLHELLAQMSDTGEVTFHGEGNRLIISNRDDFGRDLELRVYDVKEILFRIPEFSASFPAIDMGAASGQRGGGGAFTSSAGQDATELSEAGDGQDPGALLDQLIGLIQYTVEPSTWEPDGGLGRIRGFNNHVIVVYNTIEVHEKIAGFFARLK